MPNISFVALHEQISSDVVSEIFLYKKAAALYVGIIMYDRNSTNFIFVFIGSFARISKFLHSITPADLKLFLRNVYTLGAIRLKGLNLYPTKRLVISCGILGFLLAIKFIAFWGVALCNLADYRSVAGGNATCAACNSVI